MADPNANLELKVKALPNDTYDIEISPQSTVGDLKKLLVERTGMPEDRQRLIYRGRVLQNDSTLVESGLESGHTLHLVECNPDAAPQPQPPHPTAPEHPAQRVPTVTETTRISVNVGSTGPRDLQDITRIIQGVLGAVGVRPPASNPPTQPTAQSNDGGGGQQSTGSREPVPHLVMSLGNYLSRLESGGLQSRMLPLVSLGPRAADRSASARDCRALTASIVQVLQNASLAPGLQRLLARAVADFSGVEDEAASMTTVPSTTVSVSAGPDQGTTATATQGSGQSQASAYPYLPLLVAAFSDFVRRSENLMKDKVIRSFSNAIRQLENTTQIDETNLEILIGGIRQVGSIANWYASLLAELSRVSAGLISALRGDMYPLALNTASVISANGAVPCLPPLLPQGPRDSRTEGGVGFGALNPFQVQRDPQNQPSGQSGGGDAPPEPTPITLSVEQGTGPIIEQLTMALIGNGGAILEGIGSALRGNSQEAQQQPAPTAPATATATTEAPTTQEPTPEAEAPAETETTAPLPQPPSTSAASSSSEPSGQSSDRSAPAGLRAGLGARPRSQGPSSKRANADAPGQAKSEKAAKTTPATTTTPPQQTTDTPPPAPAPQGAAGMGGLLNTVAALVGGEGGGGGGRRGGGLESMVSSIASNLANNPNIRRMAENPAIHDLVSNATDPQTGAPNFSRLMGEMAPLMSSLLGHAQQPQQQQQQTAQSPASATNLNLQDLSPDRAAVWRRVFEEDAHHMETHSVSEAALSVSYLAGRATRGGSSQGLFPLGGDDSDLE